MAHHATKQATCANCHFTFRSDVPDEFCPRCGQQNHDVNLSFGHVAEEFLEGVFHFDGKVFRTARLLLLKPGELTRRFLIGQRVPYVPPIRLYVFISFIFFLVLGWAAGHTANKEADDFRQGLVIGFSKKKAADTAQTGGKPAANELNLPLSNGATINERDLVGLPDHATTMQVDSLIWRKGAEPTFGRRLIVKRFLRWRHVETAEVMHETLRVASVAMFLLMPLAALLLKLAYRRQHLYYLGHLVFTIHLHCVLFVLIMLGIPFELVGLAAVGTWLPVLIVPYFLLAMHRVYNQGWGKTLAKTLLLTTTYCILLTIGVFAGTVFIIAMA
jgi:hypothetical protein